MCMKLTEVEFWEEYWAGVTLPSVVDLTFSFERCLANELKRHLAGCSGEVLEIGCAPGKWLAFLNAELGLIPSGIEYSEAGMAATSANFSRLGITYNHIWSGDFLAIEPEERFDVVISLGFIEHFSNVDEVVARHLQWLKPGGTLVLEVPNLRGVYRPIQLVLDRSLLDKHNLEIMNLAFFRQLASRFKLTVRHIGYTGSFEPCLPVFPAGAPKSIPQRIVLAFLYLLRKMRRFKALDHLNAALISAAILAVYRKEA